MRKYIYPIVYILFGIKCIFFTIPYSNATTVEEKGIADVLKSIPQGLQCLPYTLPATGATLCYKFVSSLTYFKLTNLEFTSLRYISYELIEIASICFCWALKASS